MDIEEYIKKVEGYMEDVRKNSYLQWVSKYLEINNRLDDEGCSYSSKTEDKKNGSLIYLFHEYIEELCKESGISTTCFDDGFPTRCNYFTIDNKYYKIITMQGQGMSTFIVPMTELEKQSNKTIKIN